MWNACWKYANIFFFCCKTCICLKILENVQVCVNMIDRLDITDEYSVNCDFYLEYSYFYRRSVKYFIKKILKM